MKAHKKVKKKEFVKTEMTYIMKEKKGLVMGGQKERKEP